MENKAALLEWGLSEKEADIYLFLLERGSSIAQEISRQTGIIRQTVYEILNRLEHLGLVGEVTKDKKTYFQAEKPEKLIAILKEKQDFINSVLPSMKSLLKKSRTPSDARVFRGIKGIRGMYQDFLEAREIKTILPPEGEKHLKDFYIENWSKKRIEKKITLKILRGRKKSRFQQKFATSKKERRQIRETKQINKIDVQYIIHKDTISIIAFHKDLFGLSIRDPLILDSFNLFFDILWKQAK